MTNYMLFFMVHYVTVTSAVKEMSEIFCSGFVDRADMNAIDIITPAELSRAAAMFGTMKQLRVQLKSADEGTLDRAFEAHVHSVLEKLDERLPTLVNNEQTLSQNHMNQLMAVEVVMARHGLYDAAFQHIVMLCQTSKLQ